jgi:hypothetical protein
MNLKSQLVLTRLKVIPLLLGKSMLILSDVDSLYILCQTTFFGSVIHYFWSFSKYIGDTTNFQFQSYPFQKHLSLPELVFEQIYRNPAIFQVWNPGVLLVSWALSEVSMRFPGMFFFWISMGFPNISGANMWGFLCRPVSKERLAISKLGEVYGLEHYLSLGGVWNLNMPGENLWFTGHLISNYSNSIHSNWIYMLMDRCTCFMLV